MANAIGLLRSLRDKGISIRSGSGQLFVQAPQGALLAQDVESLRALKAEIIELLESDRIPVAADLQDPKDCEEFPLTPVQQLAWRYYMQEGGLHIRDCAFAFRISGPVSVEFLRRSTQELIRRHELLRARIVSSGGTLRQHIDPPAEFRLEVIDITSASPLCAEQQASCVVQEFVETTIDFSVGPLFDVRLIRLAPDDHVLVLAPNHIVTDGASNDILTRELWALYSQCVRGCPLFLPAPKARFSDYALWLHRSYPRWLENHGSYWMNRFRGMRRPEFPFDRDEGELSRPSGGELRFSFGDACSHGIRDIARRERTLPAIVLLAVYVAVISKWCKSYDLVIELMENGRDRPELGGVVGFIASHLHLRIGVDREMGFVDLLRSLHLEFRDAIENQDLSRVAQIVPETICDLHVNYHRAQSGINYELDTDSGISVTPFPVQKSYKSTFFKFALFLFDGGANIDAAVWYRSDLFTSSTVQRIVRNMILLAEHCIRQPNFRVASVSME